LLLHHDPDLEIEAIRVANTMRKSQLPIDAPGRLWPIYDSNLLYMPDSPAVLTALPGTEHLATFLWMFPEKTIAETRLPAYRQLLGRLQEAAGNRDEALAAYRWVENYMQQRNRTGSLLDRSREGIRRLAARQ